MPGDYNLGTAKGTIELDASSIARATAALRGMGLAMVGVGALAVAGFGYAIAKAATFEQVMSGAQSALAVTDEQMGKVKETALELGQNSIYGATNVGRAIEQLAYAGLTVNEIVGGAAKATIDLAQASGGLIGLDEAGRTVVNTMRTFGLTTKDTVHIADELAGAANKSTIDIQDMVTSFRYVGPVAHTAGLGINDVAEALAILGDRGIRGSTAGTSLRGVLLGLVAPTTRAKKELKELGIVQEDGTNIMFDSTGKMKDFATVAQILQDKTAGLSREQKIAAFNAIFQRRALASALVLAEQGAKGFEHYRKEIAAGGSAADIAAVRLDNLKGDIALFKSQLETTVIKAGTPFQNMLRQFVQLATNVIKAFGNLSPTIQTTILSVLAIGGALLAAAGSAALLAASLIKMYRVFKDVGAALQLAWALFQAIGVAIAGTVSAVVIVVAIIVVLIAILVVLYFKVQPVRDIIDDVWQGIVDIILAAWNAIYPIFVQIIRWFAENIPKAAQQVWKVLQSVWAGIQNAFARAWDVIEPILQAIADFFVKVAETAAGWGRAVVHQLSLVGRYFDKNIMPTLRAVGEFFTLLWDRITTVIQLAWAIIHPILELLMAVFRVQMRQAIDISVAAFQYLQIILGTFAAFIAVTFRAIVGIIRAIWEPVWVIIETVVAVALNNLQAAFNIFMAAVRALWTPFWNLLKRTVQIVWSAIKEIVDAAMLVLKGIIEIVTGIITLHWTKVWKGIKDLLAGIWDLIVGIVRAALELLKSLVVNGLAAVVRFFTGVPPAIVRALISFGTLLLQKGDDLIRGLFRGILQAWDTVWAWITGLKDIVLGFFSDAVHWLFDIGKKIMTGLLDGLKDGLHAIGDFLGGVGGFITDHKGPPSKDKVMLVENGQLIMNSLVTGFQKGIPALKNFLTKTTETIQGFQPTATAQLAGVGVIGPGSARNFPLTPNQLRVAPAVHVVEKGDTVHIEAHQANASPEDIVNAYFFGKAIRR